MTVLDVRRRLEWFAGHIKGALHVPLHQLPGRLADLPPGPIWVHCQAGYRASVAASLLHAAGRDVTAVDDDLGRADPVGLPLAAAQPGQCLVVLVERLDAGHEVTEQRRGNRVVGAV